jgi:alpha-beta hydrolase superfamily lysophospholipase
MTTMTTRILLWLLAGAPLLACLALAALITFGVASPPPPMPVVDGVAVAAARSQPMAPLQTFVARDGTKLAYRAYLPAAAAAAPARVAILIHGSGGSSANMNILGRALAARGVPAFAPDERGHGESGRRGDVDHIGQLEDDLADLVALVHKAYPTARLVLAGHSSGGGFALRIAGEPQGRLFDRFVLLAPYLGYAAPTSRPASGGWVASYAGRIAGLAILNRLGVHALDGLPTLAFAADPGRPVRTWSYRLMTNFGPSQGVSLSDRAGYRHDAVAAAGQVSLLAGARDESMFADRYVEAFAGLAPPVPVRVIPDIGHMDLISDPHAVPEVVQAIAR